MRRRRTARPAALLLFVLSACGSPAAPGPPAITQTAIAGLPATPTAGGGAVQAAPERWLFPGVPAHPLMDQMLPTRVPEAQAGLGGKTITGQVELRSVHLVRQDSATLAEIRQFYHDALPALGWQPLADYPGGTLYRRPAAGGANEIGLAVTLTAKDERLAVFEALQFEARGAVEPLGSIHAVASPWGPEDFEPQGIAANAAGEIYVAFKRSHTVQRLAADGTPIAAWGAGGSGPGEFGGEYNGPSGVAVGPDGSVFVVDPGNGRIQKFAPDGTHLAMIGEGQIAADDMFGATGIAVDAAGTIYLADGGQILLFNSDGALRATWPLHIPSGRRYSSAEWIAVDAAGAVYVSDNLNNLIQKYAADGSFVAEWGALGSSPGLWESPEGLAVVGDRLYVVDGSNGRIQIFSLDGALLGLIGGQDDDPAFRGGRGIAVTGGGNVLVADDYASQILSFVPTDAPALESGHPAASASALPDPQQVALLPSRPSEQDWVELGTRWLRGEPCAAPCWEGVTPGVTTVGAALDLLKRSPLIDPGSVEVVEVVDGGNEAVTESYISWTWIGNDSDGGKAGFRPAPPLPPPTPVTYSGGDVFQIRPVEPDAALLAQIVTSISPDLSAYQSDPANFRSSRLKLYTLDAVLAAFGEPSHVVAAYGGMEWSTLNLVYEKQGFALLTTTRVGVVLDGTYAPGAVIFTTDPRQAALGRLGAEFLQPWQGMRDFAFYCKPEESGDTCP